MPAHLPTLEPQQGCSGLAAAAEPRPAGARRSLNEHRPNSKGMGLEYSAVYWSWSSFRHAFYRRAVAGAAVLDEGPAWLLQTANAGAEAQRRQGVNAATLEPQQRIRGLAAAAEPRPAGARRSLNEHRHKKKGVHDPRN